MWKYILFAWIVGILIILLNYGYSKAQELDTTLAVEPLPTTYELMINDKLDVLNAYFSVPEVSSSTENLSSLPAFTTQYDRDSYILNYLIRLENELIGLYRVCGK